MDSKVPSVKIIHVITVYGHICSTPGDFSMFPMSISVDRQRGSTDFLECHDRILVGRVQSSPKNKGAKPDNPAMQPFKSLVPTELWRRISSMHSRSSFDLSSVCPTLTSRFSTFSVFTSPKVLKQSKNEGPFDPSETKFMPSSLNKASA